MKTLPLMLMATAVVLTGCKAVIETPLSLVQVVSGATKMTEGALSVEVSSCSKSEDPRAPSDALVSAQNRIPGIFPGARYVGCSSQGSEAYAGFRIPVSLDGNNDGRLESTDAFTLLNEKGAVHAVFPAGLAQRVRESRESPDGAGISEIRIQVAVKNDTPGPLAYTAHASYVNDRPHVARRLCARPGEEMRFRLADVSVDQALAQDKALFLELAPGAACQ